jgi:hypothetical protein
MATAGNRVWHDINENGIQENGEPNVNGVMVEAFDASTAQKVGETITDINGHYEIEYLEKKPYYLRFTPPSGFGFTLANAIDEAIDSDVDHSYGPNTTNAFTMVPGETNPNIDAGLRSGVLPVEWLSIDAIPHQKHINLLWSTASEINSSYFEIERSSNANEWNKIGEIPAAEYSLEVSKYLFKDYEVERGKIYYYRIKQIDQDGRYSYSAVVDGKLENIWDFYVRPNPAYEVVHMTIDIPNVNDVEVKIFASDGKMVKSFTLTSSGKGINEHIIIDDLPVGAYVAHINSIGYRESMRFIILK